MRIPSLSTVRFAALVALVLALFTSGIVVGAAGAPLILGQGNSASGRETILASNTTSPVFRINNPGTGRALELYTASAPPLKIFAQADKPPMTVNTDVKVVNLNADKLDGRTASSFLPSKTYSASASETVSVDGAETITASCDAGDALLSGGFWNVNTTSHVIDNFPVDSDSWQVFVTNEGAFVNTVYAYAVCADLGAAHIATLSAEEPQRDE